jgi:hypothetical protein
MAPFSLILLIVISTTFHAQELRESKTDLSVVGAGTFVSLEGRFSIDLPKQAHGFRAMTIETSVAKANGDYYDWVMKEGLFSVSYVDFPGPVDADKASIILSDVRSNAEKFASSNKGKVVSEKRIVLDNNPGVELRLEFPNSYMIDRSYIRSSRMYKTGVLMINQQRGYETTASKVLDSFKMLPESIN